MQINVSLTSSPIPRPHPLPVSIRAGALAEFYGVVRGEENGEAIKALVYEAYPAMAKKMMMSIATELAGERGCHAVQIIHRVGEIPVGEAAIYVGVVASHRREAFAVMSAFMDRLKQDVPIWKVGAVR